MIEGLRLLLWLQEATRRNPNAVGHLADCARCMRENPARTRQYMACGFEPPLEGAQAWQPEGYTGPALTACPGYTTKLPEVTDAAETRFYLRNGSLSSLIRGELTENMRASIAILECAESDVTRWALKNPEK